MLALMATAHWWLVHVGVSALMGHGWYVVHRVYKWRCCDVAFSPQCTIIHIASSKRGQYRQGDNVPVARTSSVTCPVEMLERYDTMAALSKQSKLRLLSGHCGHKEWQVSSFTGLPQLHSLEGAVFVKAVSAQN